MNLTTPNSDVFRGAPRSCRALGPRSVEPPLHTIYLLFSRSPYFSVSAIFALRGFFIFVALRFKIEPYNYCIWCQNTIKLYWRTKNLPIQYLFCVIITHIFFNIPMKYCRNKTVKYRKRTNQFRRGGRQSKVGVPSWPVTVTKLSHFCDSFQLEILVTPATSWVE